MRRIPLAVLISALFATAALAGGPEHDGAHHGDISKVNRSVHVGDGETAGDVESVNGSVTIGDRGGIIVRGTRLQAPLQAA